MYLPVTVYNNGHLFIKNTKLLFCQESNYTEKRSAQAFWNGELEAEMRERSELEMFGKFKADGNKELIMGIVDDLRAKENYCHSPEDCTEDCKLRGNWTDAFITF